MSEEINIIPGDGEAREKTEMREMVSAIMDTADLIGGGEMIRTTIDAISDYMDGFINTNPIEADNGLSKGRLMDMVNEVYKRVEIAKMMAILVSCADRIGELRFKRKKSE